MLSVRRVPELRFQIDRSLEHAARIEELLREVRPPGADQAEPLDESEAAGPAEPYDQAERTDQPEPSDQAEPSDRAEPPDGAEPEER